MFLDLMEENNSAKFLTLLDLLVNSGIPILLSSCSECIPRGTLMYEDPIPLTGVVIDGKLRSVILGFYSESFWLRALNYTYATKENSVLFIMPGYETVIEDKELIDKIEHFFNDKNSSLGKLNLKTTLPVILSLALVDSINPCTFTIYTTLLLSVSMVLDVEKATLAGLMFTLAIYFCYFAMGLGLIQILTFSFYAKYFLSSIALVLASFQLYRIFQSKHSSSSSPCFMLRLKLPWIAADRLIRRLLTGSKYNLMIAFLLGTAVSLTLLPCSSGPYLVGISLASGFEERSQVYGILLLYNTIFVAPLIILTLFFIIYRKLTLHFINVKRKKAEIFMIIEAVILIFASIYLLIT